MSVIAAHPHTAFDDSLYLDVLSFAAHTPWLHSFMAIFTDLGIVLAAVLWAITAWRARGRLTPTSGALLVPVGVIAAYVCSEILKSIFVEIRPCRALPVHTLVRTCPSIHDFSFPSNHSTLIAAFAVGLWFVNRKAAVVTTILALSVGVSRVYVGAHYPHDVVTGWVLGASVAGLVLLARETLAARLATARSATLRSALGLH